MLLVAPQTDLEYAAGEVQNVANALRPRLLIGDVTLAQVVQELGRADYQIVWFATHGDAEGIKLSDGYLTPEMLAQLLRPSPPRLVFLNTCSSINVAMVVHDSVNTAVIGTVCDVPDREAFVTGSVAARVIERQLAAGGELDVAAAYQESKPGQNRTYILLNGAVKLGGEGPQDDLMSMMLYLMRKQDDIVAQLSGENETLHQEIEAVNAKIDSFGARFHPRLTRTHLLAWSLGYAIFGLAGLLFQDDIANWLGLRWYTALGMVIVISVLAGVALVYGLRFSLDDERKDST